MNKEQIEYKMTLQKEVYELIAFFVEVAKETKNSAILRDIAELYKVL